MAYGRIAQRPTVYEPFCIQNAPDVRVRVPPGAYFIGDPGYAIPDDQWASFLETAARLDENTFLGTVLGYQVLAFKTYYGDGVYEDSEGYCYLVDQGMIGLVPVAMSRAIVSESSDVLDVINPIDCRSEAGVISFGSLTIDTKRLPGIHFD